MKQFFLKGKGGPHSSDQVIVTTCPGCGAKANFSPEKSNHTDYADVSTNGALHCVYGIRVCPSSDCKAIIFFRHEYGSIPETYTHPTSSSRLDVDSVPPELVADAKEALACMQVQAWKAAVVMCRRVIQVACRLHEAEGANLKEQIDDLHTRNILSIQLKDWAHQIRFFGNFAAHPDEAFGNPTEADAQSMIHFMKTFLRYVYEMPAQITEAQARSGKS